MATNMTPVGAANEGADAFVPELWARGIQNYIEKKLRFANLATDLSGMLTGSGDTINIPAVATETATTAVIHDFVDGTSAINYTQTDDTTRQLVVNEMAYVGKILPDVTQIQANPDMMTMYVQNMGYQIADAIDKKVFLSMIGTNGTGVLDGDTTQVDLATDNTFVQADLQSLIAGFYNNGIDPRDGYVMAVHPYIFKQLAMLSEFIRLDYRESANQFMSKGSVGTLLGMPLYPDHRFTQWDDGSGVPSGTNGVVVGLCWQPSNLFMAYSQRPKVVSQYSVDFLGTKMAVSSYYGAITGAKSKIISITNP
tara:strand:+ start:14583 stop:15512 length:930 start_codon:yes stop_codon:yes gene_type:complete